MNQFLELEYHDDILILKLNNPPYNYVNSKMLDELLYFSETEMQQSDKKVIIISGIGKVFCAGIEISDIPDRIVVDNEYASESKENIIKANKFIHNIENLNKPVISAINGLCVGAGVEISLACHFRLASSKARFGMVEANIGYIPAFGGTQRLLRLIGKSKALELLLTCDYFNAQEAASMGLINRVVKDVDVVISAKKLARKFLNNDYMAIINIIRSIQYGSKINLDEAIENDNQLFWNIVKRKKEIMLNDNNFSNLKDDIIKISSEILGIKEEEIDINAHFIDDLGVDSIVAVEILSAIESKYDIDGLGQHIDKMTNLNQMLSIVNSLV